MGPWAAEQGYKKIYMLAADYAAGREFLSAFKEGFVAKGGTIVGEAYSPFGQTQDWGPYLAKAKAAEPDAIFVFYAGAEAINFVKQYAQFGLQGTIPLIKPPYDRITAYDMNTGEMLWQKPHSTTPDNIRNNPALAGLAVDRLGAYGRIFIGTLTTKSLVIAGEGDVHTNADGEMVALLRAYDKDTGEDVEGEVAMPAKQTGSPMSYMHNGKQYIVVAVSRSGANAGAELIAYALP